MIQLPTHIDHTVDAPFLDAFYTEIENKTATASEGFCVNKALLSTMKVNDTVTITPSTTETSEIVKTSAPISLNKGDEIELLMHAAIQAILIQSESLYTTKCVAHATAYKECKYKATEPCKVLLVCDGGSIGSHTYTLTAIKEIPYYAYLYDKEEDKSTCYVKSFVSLIDEDGERKDENACVHFTIPACNAVDAYTGQAGNGLDIFEDRAKLSLHIYNGNHQEAWWSGREYRVMKTKIKHNNGTV